MVVLLRYVVVLALIGVWIWAAFDVIRTDADRLKHLPKLVWLGFVILFPALGVAGWLLLGRPQRIGSRLVPPAHPSQTPPDDSPEFLRSVDEEIRRRRRAEQLRRERPAPPDIPDERIDEELRRLEQQFGDDAGDDPKPEPA